jgi:hypothetical protein
MTCGYIARVIEPDCNEVPMCIFRPPLIASTL